MIAASWTHARRELLPALAILALYWGKPGGRDVAAVCHPRAVRLLLGAAIFVLMARWWRHTVLLLFGFSGVSGLTAILGKRCARPLLAMPFVCAIYVGYAAEHLRAATCPSCRGPGGFLW